jgi:hypothetical protein
LTAAAERQADRNAASEWSDDRMTDDTKRILILEAPAEPSAVTYWSRWFDEKKITYRVINNANGIALWRIMTEQEFVEFKLA